MFHVTELGIGLIQRLRNTAPAAPSGGVSQVTAAPRMAADRFVSSANDFHGAAAREMERTIAQLSQQRKLGGAGLMNEMRQIAAAFRGANDGFDQQALQMKFFAKKLEYEHLGQQLPFEAQVEFANLQDAVSAMGETRDAARMQRLQLAVQSHYRAFEAAKREAAQPAQPKQNDAAQIQEELIALSELMNRTDDVKEMSRIALLIEQRTRALENALAGVPAERAAQPQLPVNAQRIVDDLGRLSEQMSHTNDVKELRLLELRISQLTNALEVALGRR